MLTAATFKLRFPEFASIPDARIDFYIEDTADQFDVCIWGALLDKGQAYYIACLLVLQQKQAAGTTGGGYPVKSQTAGDVSVEYSNNISANTPNGILFFQSNSYGQYYLLLRDQVCPGILTVNQGSLNSACGGSLFC